MAFSETGLWADVRELPGALRATLENASGVAEAAALLRGRDVKRIVATGNGAAYYVAHALWLASLEGAAAGPPIVAVPCGVAVREGFRWQPGDAVLAVSSSGEFRDVVEIARAAGDRPCVAITAAAGLVARGRRDGDGAPARRQPARGHAHPGARGRVRRRARAVGGGDRRRGARGAARHGARGRGRARSPRPRPGRAEQEAVLAAAPPAARRRRRRRAGMGGGARARADAQGDRADPRGGRGDARGRDVGDVRARARAPDGLPRPGGRPARRRGAAAVRGDRREHAALPRGGDRRARLALITSLPAAAALSAVLARRGRPRRRQADVDGRLLRDREERRHERAAGRSSAAAASSGRRT